MSDNKAGSGSGLGGSGMETRSNRLSKLRQCWRSALEETMKLFNEYESQLNESLNTIKEHQEDLLLLKVKLDETTTENLALKDKLERASSDKVELERKLNDVIHENADVERKLQEMTSENTELERALQRAIIAKGELDRKHLGVTLKKEELERTLEGMMMEKAEVEGRLQVATIGNQVLEETLDKLNKENGELRRKLGGGRDELASITDVNDVLSISMEEGDMAPGSAASNCTQEGTQEGQATTAESDENDESKPFMTLAGIKSEPDEESVEEDEEGHPASTNPMTSYDDDEDPSLVGIKSEEDEEESEGQEGASSTGDDDDDDDQAGTEEQQAGFSGGRGVIPPGTSYATAGPSRRPDEVRRRVSCGRDAVYLYRRRLSTGRGRRRRLRRRDPNTHGRSNDRIRARFGLRAAPPRRRLIGDESPATGATTRSSSSTFTPFRPPRRQTVQVEKEILQVHVQVNHPRFRGGGNFCSCGKSFSHRKSLLGHIRNQNMDWNFPCRDCNRRFLSTYYLKAHMATQHGKTLNKSVTGCSKCGGLFSSKKAYYEHIRSGECLGQVD